MGLAAPMLRDGRPQVSEPLLIDSGVLAPAAGSVSESKLRRWLTLLDQPDRLADPDLLALLRRQRALPEGATQLELGKAAAALLVTAIEALRPEPGASRNEQLPYLVLKTCFVESAKLYQAAGRLQMSERQLSRERARALNMLAAQLAATREHVGSGYRPEPIPAIMAFAPRPGPMRELTEMIEQHHLVHVHGPRGIGKTSLVAELALAASAKTPVFWYRVRPGVNDSLTALLFDLGEHLRGHGRPALAGYIAESLPRPDPGLLTRLALRDLTGSPLLMVLDDYHLLDATQTAEGFLVEAVARVLDLRCVTIGRRYQPAAEVSGSFAVPPFGRLETKELLTRLGVRISAELSETIHQWTGGIPQLITLAASWLKTASPEEIAQGTIALADLDEVQEFLLGNVTELMDSDDRVVLEAASVFRGRFSDDALAFVAQRTRGQVQDASRRLVRYYVATRGRDGGVALLHVSVRDYVHDRLSRERLRDLHSRAAEWFSLSGDESEARHHRAVGAPAGPDSAPAAPVTEQPRPASKAGRGPKARPRSAAG